jgi:hypothetical protein
MEYPRFVACSFQRRKHAVDLHTFIDRKQSRNVLANNPGRAYRFHDSKQLRPEVSVICRAVSSSGCTERLTRESSGNNGRLSPSLMVRNLSYIRYPLDVRPMLRKYLERKRVGFNLQNRLKSFPLGGQVQSAYA